VSFRYAGEVEGEDGERRRRHKYDLLISLEGYNREKEREREREKERVMREGGGCAVHVFPCVGLFRAQMFIFYLFFISREREREVQ